MASLILKTAGGILGNSLLPGTSLLGGALTGQSIGGLIGSIAGSFIDQTLFGATGTKRQFAGPRLKDLHIQASSEGAPIAKVYGRARLAGQIIWATHFEEEITTTSQSTGGGGGGKGAPKAKSKTTEFHYFANLAIGLCEGPIARLGRIWADGTPLNLSDITYRLYTGSETQQPDSLILAKEGTTPSYRGLAYIVFEHLPLEPYGNRIPQLNFEVFRTLDDIEQDIRAITIIPGATEFGYDPNPVNRTGNPGETIPENNHSPSGQTDWEYSLDTLQEICPNLTSAGLVVSWLGTDLRCNVCELKPGVENREKITNPVSWKVAGQTRSNAYLISRFENRPAYGGTPSDHSVVRAIQNLTARGIKTVFYPFIMMDIPEANTLTDPYSNTTGQPAHPWRGRITTSLAPDQLGTPDQTAAATTEVSNFFGTATPGDFSIFGETVTYSGSQEWGLRRMILHYAHLCKAAGGVDAFLIGTELRNLLRIRSDRTTFPAITEYISLLKDVRSVLGVNTKLSYAADWSEYFGYQPADGTGDVFYHMDDLWADADIDFIGTDNYMPLSDWREGTTHLDAQAGAPSIYDLNYLKSNMAGGEGYDWYYASAADRDAQVRSPITDGGYAKPWVFRYKDMVSWWSNTHIGRIDGVETGINSPWQPESKPIWFTEAGCPAIDKGSNQPNIFFDAKSSQSALPHYSTDTRDDFIQRRYIKAFTDYWSASGPTNPVSSVYAAPMVDHTKTHFWTWDARPYPVFPDSSDIWADSINWFKGHWLTGRLGSATIAKIIGTVLDDIGFTNYETKNLHDVVDGYVIDRIMTPREALSPLTLAYQIDIVEAAPVIRFQKTGATPDLVIAEDNLVAGENNTAPIRITRKQEADLPARVKVSFIDSALDYRQSVAESIKPSTTSRHIASAELPVIVGEDKAQNIADHWIHDVWSARETAQLATPISTSALEPGDVIKLTSATGSTLWKVIEIQEGNTRRLELSSIRERNTTQVPEKRRTTTIRLPILYGAPVCQFLDLPQTSNASSTEGAYIASFAKPWPGAINLYRSPTEAGYEFIQSIISPAIMGITNTDFATGPLWRWDKKTSLDVTLYSEGLQSIEDIELFNGGNIAAIENQAGDWEVIQFKNAALISTDTYKLTYFLRGQGGSENAMQDPVPAGANFIILNNAITPIQFSEHEKTLPHNYLLGPTTYTFDHPSYVQKTYTNKNIALRPLSPVHIKANAELNGTRINWIRRTRINADAWEQVEVPLGEETERYEVEIYDGATLKRTITTTTPNLLYTNDDMTADWGGSPTSFDVQIYQLSAAYGRGAEGKATLYV